MSRCSLEDDVRLPAIATITTLRLHGNPAFELPASLPQLYPLLTQLSAPGSRPLPLPLLQSMRALALLELAREADATHHDLDTATRLFIRAARASDEPLPVHVEAAAMLRRAGRTAELMTELTEIDHSS